MRRIRFQIAVVASTCLALLTVESVFDVHADDAVVEGPQLSSAFVKRVMTITDTVLEHHIVPPTRQEMLVQGIRSVYDKIGKSPDARLGLRISDYEHHDEVTGLLRENWPRTKVPAAELEQAFITGLLSAIPGQAELLSTQDARVREQLQGNRYVGLGITLEKLSSDVALSISTVIRGGSAEQAGLKGGEIFERVDQTPITPTTSIVELTNLLRGEEGTEVTLQLRSPASKEPETLTLRRVPVVLRETVQPTNDKKQSRIWSTVPVGYLQIDAIERSTVQELREWEVKFRAVGNRALILDFRSVRRGTHHDAMLLADSLLDGCRIGRLRTRQGVRDYKADRDCLFRDFPLAVIIDESTHGAAKWVTAALQDAPGSGAHGRAVVVGTSPRKVEHDNFTYGSVSLGSMSLPDGHDTLLLATGIAERPDLQRLHLDRWDWGVKPDVSRRVMPEEVVDYSKYAMELLMGELKQGEPNKVKPTE